MTDTNVNPYSNDTPAKKEEKGFVLNIDSMNSIMKFGEMMSKSGSMVPEHLQGNPSDCAAICMQTMNWNLTNPFAVAQQTFNIKGTVGYGAQLVNSIVSESGIIEGEFEYEYSGDWSNVIGNFKEVTGKNGTYQKPAWSMKDEKGCGVKISAVFAKSGKTRVLEILLSQATVRNSTLWASDPKQQLAYLAVKRWARLYCPSVMLGIYTRDEVSEMKAEERDITPSSSTQGKQGAIKRPTEKTIERESGPSDADIKALADEYIDKISKSTELTDLVKIGNNISKTIPEGQDRINLGSVYKLRLKELQEAERERQESLAADKEDNKTNT